ncbi:MAG: IS66 family transposase [Saprospiraceae bacterium]
MSKDQIIAQKEAENAVLKAELAYLRKMIFGSKSERYKSELDVNQLNLFGQQEQVDPSADLEGPKQQISYTRTNKKHPGRNKLPEHLPVDEVILEPEQSTEGLKQIGSEITETLKYTPASLVLVRTIRPKYQKVDGQGVLIAPMPKRPIHKCIAEGSLLSHIMVSKFVDHLPFYRQIKRFKRDFDWQVSSSTINDWFVACCTLLKPVYDQMVNQIRASSYIQVDESPIKVLQSEKKKQTHQGYQWVYVNPLNKTVVFNYRKGRGMQGPKEFLADYKGYLQCDGYTVYDKIGCKEGIELVGCLAHARRYFFEALDNDKTKANHALQVIGDIYDLERTWKPLSKEERYILRQEHIVPKLQSLKEWCEQQSITALPKSRIGKAMRYFQNQYHKLIAVTYAGDLQVDNNLVENMIRPLALGRKNYMFAGSHDAGQRIAMMYSFFATCKAKNMNPNDWLYNSLQTLADSHFENFESLIP